MESDSPNKSEYLKTLYHGSFLKNLNSIIMNGFDPRQIGSNWGATYGKGIYFTDNPIIASTYSNTNIILKVKVNLIPLKLRKYYRADVRKDQLELEKLRQNAILEGYNSFETLPLKDSEMEDVEIILFPEYINTIQDMELIEIKKPKIKIKSKPKEKLKLPMNAFSLLALEDSDEDEESHEESHEDSHEDINLSGIFWNGRKFEQLSFKIKHVISCGMQGCVFRVEDNKGRHFAMKIEFSYDKITNIENFQIMYSINRFKIFPEVFSVSFIKDYSLIEYFVKSVLRDDYLTQKFEKDKDIYLTVYIMELVNTKGDYNLIKTDKSLQKKTVYENQITS